MLSRQGNFRKHYLLNSHDLPVSTLCVLASVARNIVSKFAKNELGTHQIYSLYLTTINAVLNVGD